MLDPSDGFPRKERRDSPRGSGWDGDLQGQRKEGDAGRNYSKNIQWLKVCAGLLLPGAVRERLLRASPLLSASLLASLLFLNLYLHLLGLPSFSAGRSPF